MVAYDTGHDVTQTGSESAGAWIVPLPPGYDPASPDHAAKLLSMIRSRFGPNVVLVSDTEGEAEIAQWVPGEPIVIEDDLDSAEALKSRAAEMLASRVHSDPELAGFTLDLVDTHRGIARYVRLDPATERIRRKVAEALGVHTWDVGVTIDVDGDGLAGVTITRLASIPPNRRSSALDELAHRVIGHSGWRSKENPSLGEATLVRGTPIVLPSRVSVDFESIPIEPTIETSQWGELPIGLDGQGQWVDLDMSANPHSLIQGGTGAGKSVLLRTLMWGALARGWELAVVDVSKRGLDFRNFKPWVKEGGWGCANHEAAYNVIKSAYDEGQRRADILDELDTPKWLDLPVETRRKHGFRPLMLVVDEATSLVTVEKPPTGLRPDDPERIAAQELAATQGRILTLLRKIARELRFVGVHLVVGTQQYRAEDFGSGALREQLGNRVLLGRASRTAIGMAVMNVEAAVEAVVQAYGSLGSDGDRTRDTRPGRGVAEIEGLGTIPFQSSFAQPGSSEDPGDYARDLDRRGVPRRPDDLPPEPTVAQPGSRPSGARSPARTSPDVDEWNPKMTAPSKAPVSNDWSDVLDDTPAPTPEPLDEIKLDFTLDPPVEDDWEL